MASTEVEIQKKLVLKELSFITDGGLSNRPLTSLKAPEDTMLNGKIRFPKGVDSMWNNKSLNIAKCLLPQNRNFQANGLRKSRSLPPHREMKGDEDAASFCDHKILAVAAKSSSLGSSCSRCGKRVELFTPPSTGASLALTASPQTTPLTSFLARLKERTEDRVDKEAELRAVAKAAAEAAVAAVPFPSMKSLTGAGAAVVAGKAKGVSSTQEGASSHSRSDGRGGSASSSARLRKTWCGAFSAAGDACSPDGWPDSPKRVVVPQMVEWSPLLLTNSWRPIGVRGPHPGRPWMKRQASEPPWATWTDE